MAKKPTTLLREAVAALKAIKRLNFETDADDVQMHRAMQRVDRVLAKAKAAA